MFKVVLWMGIVMTATACGDTETSSQGETDVESEGGEEQLVDVDTLSSTQVCEYMIQWYDCQGDWGNPIAFMSTCPGRIEENCSADDMNILSRFFACLDDNEGIVSCEDATHATCRSSQDIASLTQSCDEVTVLAD